MLSKKKQKRLQQKVKGKDERYQDLSEGKKNEKQQ